MKTADFDYFLPEDRIAQTPSEPRDHSRMLVLDRADGSISHGRFFEIGEFLKPGDLLVVNESKVFKARLSGNVGADLVPAQPNRQGIEIFLLRADGPNWIALAKPGKKLLIGSTVTFTDGTSCRVVDKLPDGTVYLDFGKSAEDVLAWTDRVGSVPLPPYIKQSSDAARYQTVYATETGSVAAPTAGLHFTPQLIGKLKLRGIDFASVILHVGLGTFRPVKTETLEEHEMHEEWVDVPDATMRAIEETKQRGGRVIAVGTTTVRSLESGVRHGFTDMFITPGYTFKIVDGMITNFHLPKSTLLVLVSAFAGRENVLSAYSQVIAEGYRFYSFGDAMLIL